MLKTRNVIYITCIMEKKGNKIKKTKSYISMYSLLRRYIYISILLYIKKEKKIYICKW